MKRFDKSGWSNKTILEHLASLFDNEKILYILCDFIAAAHLNLLILPRNPTLSCLSGEHESSFL